MVGHGSEHRGGEAEAPPKGTDSRWHPGQRQGPGGGVGLESPRALTPPFPTPLRPSPFLPPPLNPRGSLNPQRPSQQPRFSPGAWQVLGLEARLASPAPEVQSDLERVWGGAGALKPTHILQGEGGTHLFNSTSQGSACSPPHGDPCSLDTDHLLTVPLNSALRGPLTSVTAWVPTSLVS